MAALCAAVWSMNVAMSTAQEPDVPVPSLVVPCTLDVTPPEQDHATMAAVASVTCVADRISGPIEVTGQVCVIAVVLESTEDCAPIGTTFVEQAVGTIQTRSFRARRLICTFGVPYYSFAEATFTAPWYQNEDEVVAVGGAAPCGPYL